ncbi:UDP-GlcNAc3NAcA epimerase [Candidatus Brocadiaceae bacterium]|nr:UDP-GlcNAc3NAcA epimerase [Candidatus Brocadiaceae bacterium]
MKKLLSIVGARPQFIKLAPLVLALLDRDISHKILHTGQHFDAAMSRLIFSDLKIPKPDYQLDINRGTHGQQTGLMLSSIEAILLKEKPDGVVVFGDTNSTLAGALAAVKLQITTFHIEAGLRSFNRTMPEEINRILTDHCSDVLFAPTTEAITNLNKEGLMAKSLLSGDIMVDSITMALNLINPHKIEYSTQWGEYYLLTLHRPYNVDDSIKLQRILNELGRMNRTIVFPVHPRTRKIISEVGMEIPACITIIDPVGYLEFINLQRQATGIITDSGGIQKEAYLLRKPCITLRSETEWIETVQSGWNLLIDVETHDNVAEDILSFSTPDYHPEIFGSGVSNKILSSIMSRLEDY